MKQKRITDLRREKGLDAVLVTNPLNVRYISGCTADACICRIRPASF